MPYSQWYMLSSVAMCSYVNIWQSQFDCKQSPRCHTNNWKSTGDPSGKMKPWSFWTPQLVLCQRRKQSKQVEKRKNEQTLPDAVMQRLWSWWCHVPAPSVWHRRQLTVFCRSSSNKSTRGIRTCTNCCLLIENTCSVEFACALSSHCLIAELLNAHTIHWQLSLCFCQLFSPHWVATELRSN